MFFNKILKWIVCAQYQYNDLYFVLFFVYSWQINNLATILKSFKNQSKIHLVQKRFYAIYSFLPNLFCSISYAQNSYPQDYFRSPLEIPLVLAGSFAELRSNHFHSGLDIKTQQRTGLKVFAAADGFISRIKISHYGYGKALYITHPNGYTSVYAHLANFNPEIEAYVKKQQYKETNLFHIFENTITIPIENLKWFLIVKYTEE